MTEELKRNDTDIPTATKETPSGTWPADEEVASGGGDATAHTAAAEPEQFSIAALRLSTDYMAEAAVKKIVTAIPVRRPSKTTFIRVREGSEWTLSTCVLELKDQGEWYVVAKSIWPSIPAELVAVTFHVAVTREGTLFLIPVRLPDSSGRRNQWHESLIEAVSIAKRSWARIIANMDLGGYDVLVAQGDNPEPVWPDLSMQQIVDIAFRGRKVDNLDHPIIRSLLGKA